MISRVFQKTGLLSTGAAGAGAGAIVSVSSGTGTSKKTKIPSTISTNYQEQPSSPSSVSLPPLLGYTDSSCSYDGHSTNTTVTATAITEHVSCFSTATTTNTTTALGLDVNVDSFNHFPPPGFDPLPRFVSRNVSNLSNFRSFQDNFNQFPYFGSSSTSTMTSSVHLPSSQSGGSGVSGMNYWLQATAVENETKAGLFHAGLDSLWNY